MVGVVQCVSLQHLAQGSVQVDRLVTHSYQLQLVSCRATHSQEGGPQDGRSVVSVDDPDSPTAVAVVAVVGLSPLETEGGVGDSEPGSDAPLFPRADSTY
jgi:hypothetical protein